MNSAEENIALTKLFKVWWFEDGSEEGTMRLI